jgi:hypothetical protein
MTEWANYDANGKRVPSVSTRAVFRAKEVSVDTGVAALPGHPSVAGVEYRDVHAIDRPDLRKTFKSFSQMCSDGSRNMLQVQKTTRGWTNKRLSDRIRCGTLAHSIVWCRAARRDVR